MSRSLAENQIRALNGVRVVIAIDHLNTLKLIPLDETRRPIEVEPCLKGDDDEGYWPELEYKISED